MLLAPDTASGLQRLGRAQPYWGRAAGDSANRARAVGADRPYAEGLGLRVCDPDAGGDARRAAETSAYADDVDLHRHPQLLDGAAGLISMGHDEYYSVAMRRALTTARGRGTNLAFFGANAVYRRIRLRPTSVGPDRLEVNYKDAAEDPLSRRHPSQTTANWPSPPAADPPGRLLGASYGCFPGHGDLVVADASSWLLTGTKLRRGDPLAGALGPEFDASSAQHPCRGRSMWCCTLPSSAVNSAVRRHHLLPAKSGAGVFNTGTMGWVKALAGQDGRRTQTLVEKITKTLLRSPGRGRRCPSCS